MAKNVKAISLDGKDEQLANELTERTDGGMIASLRGTGRLLGINSGSLHSALHGKAAGFSAPKLAQYLVSHGFEPAGFKSGIPDEAIPHIAKFYADKGNQHARNLLLACATVGVRVSLRVAKGLPATVAPQVSSANADVISIMNNAANTIAQLSAKVEQLHRIEQAVAEDGYLAGLKPLFDEAIASEQKLLPSGDKFTASEFLAQYGQKGYAQSRGFRVAYSQQLANAYRTCTGREPACKTDSSTFVYDSIYAKVALEVLSRYLPIYQAKQAAKLEHFKGSYCY